MKRLLVLIYAFAVAGGCHLALPLSPADDAGAAPPDSSPFDLGPVEASPLKGCGNSIAEGLEVCDGDDLRGATCDSIGFLGGTLACSACKLDTRTCQLPAGGHASLLHGGKTGLFARRLDLEKATWGERVPIPGLVGTPRWMVNRISPKNQREEVAAVLTETPAGMRLHLLHFGRGGWVLDESVPLDVPLLDADKRVFDLVRGPSGNALLVHSDGTANPRYRTYVADKGWSVAKPVFAKPPGTASVRWVVLAPRPANDVVALVYSDADTYIHGATWSGSAFAGTKKALDGPVGMTDQSFDAVYQQQSGQLMITSATLYNMCCGWILGEAWQGGPCGYWSFQRLAVRRGHDAVALVGDDANAVIFDGSSWKKTADLWPSNAEYGTYGARWADVAWVGSSPKALFVHRGWNDTNDPDGRGKLHWASADLSGTWSKGTPLTVPKMGELTRVQLEPHPAEDRVLAAFADDAGSLWTARFGTAWSGVELLATGELPMTHSRPFSFDIWQEAPSP